MNYITIDFETANSNLSSACSIGIVVVENGSIKERLHYYINPGELFSDYNILIHGITSKDVQNSDTFKDLWPKIKHLFMNTTVYAHNAYFDLSVLKAVIDKYDLEPPTIKWGCTLKIARKLWKDELQNFKLGTISQFLNLDHLHHNALSDAHVCYEIINRGKRIMQVDSDIELYEILAIRYGEYNLDRFYSSYNKYSRKKNVKIIENEYLNNKVIYLSGKPQQLTKRELTKRLIDNGAYVESNINLSLDYFVILQNSPKLNHEKLDALNDNNHKIKRLNENELLGMLK